METESLPIWNSSPLFIGAVGGSGTRVVARLAKRAGYFLGTNLNEPQDAMELFEFHEKWIDRYLAAEVAGTPLSSGEKREMERDFHESIARHLQHWPELNTSGARWGWKAPRGIFLLPFLHAQFPALRFVHVLRDGRDMAFAANLGQLDKHSGHILTSRERWFGRRPERAISFWDRVNSRAALFAETHLLQNYHVLRLEDLCEHPVETTADLLHFLGVDGDAEAIAAAEVSPPRTIGRWRSSGDRLVADLHRAGSTALRKFGYLAGALGPCLGLFFDVDLDFDFGAF
jgi:hypothetical protein